MMKYDDQGRLMINLGAAAVFGPGASTDNAIVRWDGVAGTAIQDSLVTISDAGDVTLPQDIIHAGDADTYLRFTDDRLRAVVGGVDILDITEAGADTVVWNEGGADVDFRWETLGGTHSLFIDGLNGKVFINETINTFMTTGLTIHQGNNNLESLAIKRTGVAHGCTNAAETDTYGTMVPVGGTAGGLAVKGYRDSSGTNYFALYLHGILDENVDTTKNAGGHGIIELVASEVAAGNTAAVVVNGNLVTISDNGLTRFIVDKEGDLFADGGTATTQMVTKYDDYEDAHLVRAFDMARAAKKGEPIKDQWSDFIKYNERKLVDLGILGDTLENGGLTNVTRLQQLHNGAIWQNYTAIKEHDKRLATYERAFEKISQALGIPT